MDPYPLHTSLLPTTTVTSAVATTTTASTTTTAYGGQTTFTPKPKPPNTITNVPSITLRLFFISFIGIIAIWANQEASKGFSITVVNDAGKYSLSGKRFSLFYESNGKMTRIVLNTSRFVEDLLYPNQDFLHVKKQIKGVTIRLASKTFPANVSVDSRKPHEYLVKLSPSLMEAYNNDEVVVLAVLQAMARVWLWDGQGAAPPLLLNGVVEYISSLAGFTVKSSRWNSGGEVIMSPEKNEVCWKDEDPRKVAGFLRFCDERTQPDGGSGGGGEVIRRLNHGMRNGWHDWMVDDALGMAGQNACEAYDMMMRSHHLSSSM